MKAHAWRAPSVLLALVLLAGVACGGGEGDTAPADGAADETTGEEDAGDGEPVEDAERPDDPDPDEAAEPSVDAPSDGPALRVSTPGFDGETIVVGALVPPPGSAHAKASAAAIAGIEAYVARLHRRGGVLGRHPVEVRRVPVADGTDGARDAYEATRDDVLLYVHVPRGIAGRLLEPFEADDVVGVPAATGGRWLREQNALAFLTPDEMQVANGIDWALADAGHPMVTVDELRARWSSVLGTATGAAGTGAAGAPDDHVVCAAVRRGDRGSTVADAVRAVARSRGVTVGTVAQLPPGDRDGRAVRRASREVITTLRSAACETVVLGSAPDQTAPLLAAAADRWYAPRWVGLSSAWSPGLARGPIADYARDRLVVVGNGLVDWAADDAPAAATALRAARDDHAPDTADGDLHFALGYAQALVVRQVIDRALAMGDMSRAGVINAINTLDELRLDGLADDVSYGKPEMRRTPRRSAVFSVDPEAPWGLRTITARRAWPSTVVVSRELNLR